MFNRLEGFSNFSIKAVFLTFSSLASINAGALTIDTDWVPDDIVVSNPDTSMPDPEFDPVTGYVAWQFGPNSRVASGRLLVAIIDSTSGELLDPINGLPLQSGGRGLEVDRDLVSRDLTKNGPEFAFAQGGSRLLYTRFNEANEPSLAQAEFDGTEWLPELLAAGQNRITPEGSKDLDDNSPRVAYFGFAQGGSNRQLGVRIINLPFTERIAPIEIDAASFMPNESALLTTAVTQGGLRQVFYYDYDQDLITQITNDPSAKLKSPEPWSAPEIGGNTLFAMGVRNQAGESLARVYYRDEQEVWRIMMEIRSPDRVKPYISTPVPFVYEGVSYIVFRTQVNPEQRLASDIWVVNAAKNPQNRVYRKINADADTSRYDQEVYITDSGPVVYYTEIADGQQRIRLCRTGILPQQALDPL